MWCVHSGETTSVADCPYTKEKGLLCSMRHTDMWKSRYIYERNRSKHPSEL
jgi:hypothetical protein